MGITLLGIEGDGPALVGDGGLGIAEGQGHIAPVAPGGRIAGSQLQHLVPEGQGITEATLTAGAEGLVEELGQAQLHRQKHRQQGGDHAAASARAR